MLVSFVTADDPFIVVAYDTGWPALFRVDAARLRAAFGAVAVRIDHIGSTAVPGLAAKPIIDIQISVAAFEPLAAYQAPLAALGYVFRADNTDRMKRYFREPPGARRIHLHVRQQGSWSEQFALLCRDYLRTHPETAARYAALKQGLAVQFGQPGQQRQAYVDAKVPFIWATMAAADAWAQATGWRPGPSDA